MNGIEVIEVILRSIHTQKEKGAKALPIETLELVLEKLREMIGPTEMPTVPTSLPRPNATASTEAAIEHYKAVLNGHLEQQKRTHEWDIEMVRAAVAYGQFAIKSALLINGGAAIALLAFLGNVWSKGDAGGIVVAMAGSLKIFAWGVLAAGAASGVSYFSQSGFANAFGRHSQRWGAWLQIVAMLLGIVAFVVFGLGALDAANSIKVVAPALTQSVSCGWT